MLEQQQSPANNELTHANRLVPLYRLGDADVSWHHTKPRQPLSIPSSYLYIISFFFLFFFFLFLSFFFFHILFVNNSTNCECTLPMEYNTLPIEMKQHKYRVSFQATFVVLVILLVSVTLCVPAIDALELQSSISVSPHESDSVEVIAALDNKDDGTGEADTAAPGPVTATDTPKAPIPDFEATHEWKTILKDQAVPPGLEIQVDLTTGERRARLMEGDDGSRFGRPQAMVDREKYEREHVPDKAIPSTMSPDGPDDLPPRHMPPKPLQDELHLAHAVREFEKYERGLAQESDRALIVDLLRVLVTPIASVENVQLALHTLEELVHDVDNVDAFIRNGGIAVALARTENPFQKTKHIHTGQKGHEHVYSASTVEHKDGDFQAEHDIFSPESNTDSTDNTVYSPETTAHGMQEAFYRQQDIGMKISASASWLLGSAMQNWAPAQTAAVESHGVTRLLRVLHYAIDNSEQRSLSGFTSYELSSKPDTFRDITAELQRRVLFALSALLRGNAAAQQEMHEVNGLSLIARMYDLDITRKPVDQRRVRRKCMNFIEDLLNDDAITFQSGSELGATLHSDGWCSRIANILMQTDDDLVREPALKSIIQLTHKDSCSRLLRDAKFSQFMRRLVDDWHSAATSPDDPDEFAASLERLGRLLLPQTV
jgi:hypothetical protein